MKHFHASYELSETIPKNAILRDLIKSLAGNIGEVVYTDAIESKRCGKDIISVQCNLLRRKELEKYNELMKKAFDSKDVKEIKDLLLEIDKVILH
jgi:hypothetical protein